MSLCRLMLLNSLVIIIVGSGQRISSCMLTVNAGWDFSDKCVKFLAYTWRNAIPRHNTWWLSDTTFVVLYTRPANAQ